MRLLIIGTGPAGITVAEQVRERDKDAEIVMISTEPFPPYSPPAMADYFESGREEAVFWKGRDACVRLRVDLHAPATVTRVLTGSHRLELEGGAMLGYDRLVVASGSRLHAPVEGNDLEGISNFKSMRAATALVERVRHGSARSAIVVGAGFIGVEVALLLRALGLEVSMIEAEDRLMPRMLDGETAGIVQQVIEKRGVSLTLGEKVEGFHGRRRVKGVDLESGERRKADVYVAATGVKPAIGFLEGSGIETHWGVLVDDHLQSSVPDVYVCGDVAETRDRLTGERYVHAIFPNAVAQARVVAANVLGDAVVYEGAESMNSLKHVGLPVMAVGAIEGEETLRLRRGEVLRKVFLDGGRIVGFRLAGDVRAAGILRSLMLRGVDVSALGDRLVDPGFGIADVAFAAPGTLRPAAQWPV